MADLQREFTKNNLPIPTFALYQVIISLTSTCELSVHLTKLLVNCSKVCEFTKKLAIFTREFLCKLPRLKVQIYSFVKFLRPSGGIVLGDCGRYLPT